MAYPEDTIYGELIKMQEEKKELIVEDINLLKNSRLVEKPKQLWNWKVGIDKIQSKINTFSLPAKPSTFGQEYQFPEDIVNLTSNGLGQWLFKLAGWKGYALRLLSVIEMNGSILDDSYDTAIAKKISLSDGKRITKDLALGLGVSEDAGFRHLRIKLIESKAEISAIKRLVELYTMQLDTISREISRRAIEVKYFQAGIGKED